MNGRGSMGELMGMRGGGGGVRGSRGQLIGMGGGGGGVQWQQGGVVGCEGRVLSQQEGGGVQG